MPMKGKTNSEIKQQLNLKKQRLEELFGVEFELIDSCINEDAPKDTTNPALWFMGKSISMMADADLVYFSKGWENATGCRIEHEIARAYNIKRLYFNNIRNNMDFQKIKECMTTISKMEVHKNFMLKQGHVLVADILSAEIGKLHAAIDKIIKDSDNEHIYKTRWEDIHELEEKIKTLESVRSKYASEKGLSFIKAIDEDIDRLRNQIHEIFKEMARRLD